MKFNSRKKLVMILEVGGKIRWLSASIETVREKDFRVHSNNHSINKLITLNYYMASSASGQYAANSVF